jgi:signal transduction histidine kinase
VAQEGLANALKHGSAGPVTVALRYLPDAVQIEVLNPTAPDRGRAAGSRLGLVGIRERVGVFGGRLRVGPRDDDHWGLEAGFPAPP